MPDIAYSGVASLEAMEGATLYNNTIFAWLDKGSQGAERILDFGAGAGEFSNRFAGRNITAFEPDTYLASKIRVKTVTNMGHLSGLYDFVFMVNVLEHIEDDNGALDTIGKMLSPGGKLFIFVPAFTCLYSDMDREVGHIRRYTKQELVNLLENNGYSVKICRYFDFLGFFCTVAYKFMRLFKRRVRSSLSPQAVSIYDTLVFPYSRFIDLFTSGHFLGKNLVIEATKEG